MCLNKASPLAVAPKNIKCYKVLRLGTQGAERGKLYAPYRIEYQYPKKGTLVQSDLDPVDACGDVSVGLHSMANMSGAKDELDYWRGRPWTAHNGFKYNLYECSIPAGANYHTGWFDGEAYASDKLIVKRAIKVSG